MSDELDSLKAENDALRNRLEKLEERVNPPPRPPSTHQPIDYTANASMPASAMKAMIDALPSSFMSDLRADALKPNPVTQGPNPQPAQVKRGSGWVSERGFPDRTKEFELMDRIVASQVGGPNEKVK